MKQDDYVFFWSGPYSQWAKYDMTIDGVSYNCCEQYMMAEKARLFGDKQVEKAIMEAHDPAFQKKLGKNVRNFDESVWVAHREDIVYRANLAKFTQHPALKKNLLDTEYKTIVEASPVDFIWGIGMDRKHPDVTDQSKWKGLNLLGKAIMRARETIRNAE